MSAYAADGSLNVTVVTGSSYVGYFAADGSTNITGSTGTGYHHRSGAISAISSLDGNILTGRTAPDGSLYVNNQGFNNGSQKITYVSGSL